MFDDIDFKTTLNDLLNKYPDALTVLYAFHVDVCCGGGKSIEEVAKEKGFTAADLIDALKESLLGRSMPFAG